MGEFTSLENALEIQNLVIEKPRPGDIFALATFSKGLGFTESMWRSLERAGNVVCARHRSGRIDGFYIAHHYSVHREEYEIRHLRAGLNVLINRSHLDPTSVAFGAQSAVAEAWQDSELRLHLLRGLLRSVGLRYRHLFCCCRTDEFAEINRLRHEGWRCYQEEDEMCFFDLDVAKALRGLASSLMLKAPARASLGAAPNRLHA